MGDKRTFRNSIAKIKFYFSVFIASALLLNSNAIFEFMFPSLVEIHESPSSTDTSAIWEAQPNLPDGVYFISMGRPQGSCNLFFNDALIDSNEGTATSERSALTIGSKIKVFANENQKITFICKTTAGSPIRLIHSPYVNTYRLGLFVHLSRIISDLFFPFISVLLMGIYFLFVIKDSSLKVPLAAKLSGIFTTLYLISLCNIPRLFLSNKEAFYIHTTLKVLFIGSILHWLFSKKGAKRITNIFLGTSLVSLGLAFLFCYQYFFATYMVFYHLIPCIAALGTALSLKSSSNDYRSNLLSIMVPFITYSTIDCVIYDFGRGGYLTSATSLSIFILSSYSYLKSEKAKNLSRKAITILASKQLERTSMTDSLKQMTMVLSECLKFSSWSVYVDSYILGLSPRPGRELRRLTSSEIREKSNNNLISLEANSDDDSPMKEALLSKSPVVKHDPRTYGTSIIIPIGETCCLNLSTSSRPKFDEEFIRTFIEESHPQINAIALTMMKVESTASLSTNLLKEELGVGTHNLEFGAIFADAVGYTQNVKSTKSFIEFFEREYIPSLLRNLDKKVILKDLFGDELYLVVLPKEISSTADSNNIHETTLEMIRLITDFSLGSGAELCRAAGYKPIEFKIGANAGPGQIVVSHTNVALSGPVIEAKRCQGRARASEPFITDELIKHVSASVRDASIKEVYAAKKEILVGYRISRHDKAA